MCFHLVGKSRHSSSLLPWSPFVSNLGPFGQAHPEMLLGCLFFSDTSIVTHQPGTFRSRNASHREVTSQKHQRRLNSWRPQMIAGASNANKKTAVSSSQPKIEKSGLQNWTKLAHIKNRKEKSQKTQKEGVVHLVVHEQWAILDLISNANCAGKTHSNFPADAPTSKRDAGCIELIRNRRV